MPPSRWWAPIRRPAAGLGAVVVYLPERLSRHGGRLLDAVAERRRPVGAGRDHRRCPGRRRGGPVGPAPGPCDGASAPPAGHRTSGRGRRAHGPGSSPCPTATRRCGRRCGPWSTRPGRGRRSTGWPSSTPAPSPTPGWSTSSLSAAGIALNGAAVDAAHGPGGRAHVAAAPGPSRKRLPPRGRLRLVGRGPAAPPRRRPSPSRPGSGSRVTPAWSPDATTGTGAGHLRRRLRRRSRPGRGRSRRRRLAGRAGRAPTPSGPVTCGTSCSA